MPHPLHACSGTRVAVNSFLETAAQQLQSRIDAVDRLATLHSTVSEIAATLVSDGERRIGVLTPPPDSVILMTVELTPYELRLARDGLSIERTAGERRTISIRAFRKRNVVAEFAAGLAYTSVEYAQFGTTTVEAKTVIERAKPKEEESLPLFMLNLVLDAWDGGTLPILQLGISTAEDRPVFAAGAGLRLKALGLGAAFTGGAVWTWKPELVGANVGDLISGTAALQDAIETRFDSTPGLYIALAINP